MEENPAALPLDSDVASLGSAATNAGEQRSVVAPRLRAALAPGALLAGRYRVERFLARGGMGEVHAAHDELLDVPLALKTLRLDLEGDPARLKRFKRELLLARSITHPNVCRVYELEVDRSTARVLFFLTMELLPGETLRARILARGRLTVAEALPLVRQMATALDAAHAAGIVHRDFKSANVILVPGAAAERAVVTDFGLARLNQAPSAEASDLTRLGDLVGTPAYMAPEQVRGETAGPAADVYALGVVLFEMVTGRLPFAGTTTEMARRRLEAAPPSASALVPDLDPRWEATIRRCLALKPGERFVRAGEVFAALAGDVAAHAPSRLVLPAERDAFVGREAALAELGRRLDGGARLVTLVGPGGTGKTRLAVRHGWSARAEFTGVWFCDLTEARSVEGIAAAIASALALALGKGDPVVQLGHAIAGRGHALLILDNFEQVVEHAAATVGHWLARAPGARFLVTSRERLGIAGEEAQELAPLDEDEGVRLFLTRARAYRPGCGSEPGDEEEARQVVRLVDGLPLAIELAAARVRILGVGQILERLKDRFKLLAGGTSSRHATLRTAIDSSWELLRPWEQAAFAQCAVFEGGFTLEAAEAVVDLGAWPEAPWLVDVVQALVDKSLARMWVPEGGGGEPRFAMYVSLQAYARERLAEGRPWPVAADGAPAERSAEQRHGACYAGLGSKAALAALETHGGVARLHMLTRELDNLIAACRRAVARGDETTAVAALAAAWTVLELKGPFRLGAELAREVLSLGSLAPPARGHALRILASALKVAGRLDEARSHFDQALAITREAGDRDSAGNILRTLASLHRETGQMEEAMGYCHEALASARDAGNRHAEGIILCSRGSLHDIQGRTEEGLRDFDEALAIARDAGNRRLEGIVLGNLAVAHYAEGRMREAREHLEKALAIQDEVGDRGFVGMYLCHLGHLDGDEGRMDEALRHYQEALASAREVGNRSVEGFVLGNLGVLHHEQGRAEEALRHFQDARAIAREVGNRRSEGVALGNLGSLHQALGRSEEALRHYHEGIAIAREIGDRRTEGRFLGELGALHAEQGRHEEAGEAFAVAESLLRAVNDRFGLGSLLCRRGECARLAGEHPAARELLAAAETIAREVAAGPASELGRDIARLGAALGGVAAPPRG